MAAGGQKSSPKLRRSGKPSIKSRYKQQFMRTYKNKLRRVRKHNGEAAAVEYQKKYNPYTGTGG